MAGPDDQSIRSAKKPSTANLSEWIGDRISYAYHCFRILVELVTSQTGCPIQELRTVGGGTRNCFWQQLKVDVLGITIEVPAAEEATAHGVALLAGVGVGVFKDAEQAAISVYRSSIQYRPDPNSRQDYHELYQAGYQPLNSQIRTLLAKL